MSVTGIHWPAVLASAVAAFISGGLWFGPKTFFPVWWKAMGRKEGENPGAGMNMAVVFGATFAAQLVQATALAVFIEGAREAAAAGSFGALDGAAIGLVAGLGLAAASSLSHRLFAGHGFKVWALEVSNDVLNLVLMGVILAAWS